MATSAVLTIERHILEQQKKYPHATGAFTGLLYDVALAAKIIARETTRAGLVNILGATEDENVYGERQQKLDLYANRVIFQMNDHTGRLCVMASEENEDLIPIPEQFAKGRYVLLYDPLDGSSNIDVNISIGTIFAIHRKISPDEDGTLEDALQPASKLVAAGYVIYGSSTMMVYSTGQGVHGFTLDPSVGEFLLSHENIRLPETPRYYSCNQGYESQWPKGVQAYTKWLQGMGETKREPLTARYIGSMVADFHRNLMRGGIFYYPGTMDAPDGKMRLMFEAQALSFIISQAGGYASDGIGSVLDLQPHALHQRVPLFLGNRELVETAENYIREHDQDWIKTYLPMRQNKVKV